MADVTFSRHAREEIERRRLDPAAVDDVLRMLEQVVPGHAGLRVRQSRVQASGKSYLLRAVVDDTVDPAVVVTVYRTSKISKYWRSDDEGHV